MNEAGPARRRGESPLHRQVRRAGPLLVALGRFGYVVEGLVFILVGLLATQVALGLVAYGLFLLAEAHFHRVAVT